MSTDIVNTFYSSLAAGDGEAMAACYSPDIVRSKVRSTARANLATFQSEMS